MRSLLRPGPVALLAAVASCQVVPSVAFVPRVGTREVSGDFLITSGGSSSGADVETMGLQEDEVVFLPRAEVSWLGFDMWASGSNAEYAGDGVLEQTFDLGGVTIIAGDSVHSSFDLTSATAAATFDLVPSDAVDVGIGIGVAYFDFDAEVRSLTTSERIATSQEFVMPVLAARLESDIGPLRANVVGTGLTGSYGGAEGTYFDIDGYLEYHLTDLVGFRLGLVIGYQLSVFDFRYTDSDGAVDADLDFQGPYVGLTLGT